MIRKVLGEQNTKTEKTELSEKYIPNRWGSGENFHHDLNELSFSNSPSHWEHRVLKAMDKISNLPKIILHDILSRLPEKDAARTSVLSKTWHDVWSSFPILVFDGFNRGIFISYKDLGNSQKMEDHMRKVNNFLNSVDGTLLRFHDNGLAVNEFKLIMDFFDPQSMPPRFNGWMKLASESGVKVLKLELDQRDLSWSFDKYYQLPPSVLEAKSLIKLELLGIIRVDQAFLNFGIKFSSLQELSLTRVYLDHEKTLQNLISSCPLIENLTLNQCKGLEFVSIHGLPKLKGAKIFEMQEVEVDAQSLEYLHVGAEALRFPCKINMDKCSSLRELFLNSESTIFVTSQWLLELSGKFPLLERLDLDGCIMSERIKISSVRLKFLNLGACFDWKLKEAEIDAPNLETCRYRGIDFTMPAISFLNSSNQLEFTVLFIIQFRLNLESLRTFLQNIKPSNVLASLTLRIICGTIQFNPDALQDISLPPPRIKHLNLSVLYETEESCLPLVTGLFWSFRPAIISLKLRHCSKIFIKLFYEKLTCRQEEDGCSSSSQMKCWWHDLKDVKVTSSSKNFENVVDCQTLLDALPSEMTTLLEEDEISFRLEWQSY